MDEREQQRKVRHRLAVLRHAEEVTGSVAATCRYYGITRQCFYKWRRFDRLGQLRAEIDTWLVDNNIRRPNHSDFMRGRTPRQVLDAHRKKRAS